MSDQTSQDMLIARICDPSLKVQDLTEAELILAKERWKRNAMTELIIGMFLLFAAAPLLLVHFLLHHFLAVSWWWVLVSSVVVLLGLTLFYAIRIEKLTAGGLPDNWFNELRIWASKQQERTKQERLQMHDNGKPVNAAFRWLSGIGCVLVTFLTAGASLLLVLAVGAIFYFHGGITPPIAVGWRDSLVGNGSVLKMQNTGAETVYGLWVAYDDTEKGQVKYVAADSLHSGDSKELGWLEGFHFRHGSHITIGAKGFLPETANVPN
jgi:hypothetical protein